MSLRGDFIYLLLTSVDAVPFVGTFEALQTCLMKISCEFHVGSYKRAAPITSFHTMRNTIRREDGDF